jgi:hypothetical protein
MTDDPVSGSCISKSSSRLITKKMRTLPMIILSHRRSNLASGVRALVLCIAVARLMSGCARPRAEDQVDRATGTAKLEPALRRGMTPEEVLNALPYPIAQQPPIFVPPTLSHYTAVWFSDGSAGEVVVADFVLEAPDRYALRSWRYEPRGKWFSISATTQSGR